MSSISEIEGLRCACLLKEVFTVAELKEEQNQIKIYAHEMAPRGQQLLS